MGGGEDWPGPWICSTISGCRISVAIAAADLQARACHHVATNPDAMLLGHHKDIDWATDQ